MQSWGGDSSHISWSLKKGETLGSNSFVAIEDYFFFLKSPKDDDYLTFVLEAADIPSQPPKSGQSQQSKAC